MPPNLKDLLGVDKPVVAMAHLPPLPGTPLYDEVGGRGRSSSPWRPVTGPSASTTGAMRTRSGRRGGLGRLVHSRGFPVDEERATPFMGEVRAMREGLQG